MSCATVYQVDALARELGPRSRLLVCIAAYGPARPEEQAALRRHDVDLANLGVWVRSAEPELNTGKRAPGEIKSEAGKRFIVLPDFMRGDLKLHMYLYAEQKVDGLLFVGERGAPFRRTALGRKGKKARKKVGLPEGFTLYDLRHTGHTLSTQSGATLRAQASGTDLARERWRGLGNTKAPGR